MVTTGNFSNIRSHNILGVKYVAHRHLWSGSVEPGLSFRREGGVHIVPNGLILSSHGTPTQEALYSVNKTKYYKQKL